MLSSFVGVDSSWPQKLRLMILPIVLAAVPAHADQYDVLRTNWVSIITGMTNFAVGATNNYNTNDPYVAAAINSNVIYATEYEGYMTANTNTNYLFSNITNVGSNADSSFIVSTYQQLEEMAQAYVLQGSSLQGNQALLSNIIKGLDWMNANWYNSNTPHDLTSQFPKTWNWFDLEISGAQYLVNTVSLVYTNLTSNQITAYMAAVNQQEQYNANTPTNTPHFTGANCANKANVITVAGVLLKNGTQVGEGASSYGSIVFPFVTNGDGFYTDGSFVFHSQTNIAGSNPAYIGGFAYNSGYGISLLDIVPPTLQMLSGSAWDITNSTSPSYSSNWTNLIAWVYNSYEPIVYDGGAMTLCDGRQRVYNYPEFARGHNVMEDVLRISSFVPPADAAKMQSMVKYWAQKDTNYPFLYRCSLPVLPAAEILMTNSNVTPLPELTGNFPFPNMDCMVHLKPGWGFGIEAYSTRRCNYESINNENYWGWHQGDGGTYLYNADQGQYSDGFWWTVNPYRLPGTTVDSQQSLTNSQDAGRVSTESWVGGVSWNGYGAEGMQLNDSNALQNSLVAKKSWFLFTNEVVCLGAGITSPSNHVIETIVDNRCISSAGNDALSLNGTNFDVTIPTSNSVSGINWAHLTGRVPGSDVSYYFPTSATLQVLREQRSGSQANVMTNGSTTVITNNYITLWFNHGAKPTNATYSYVVLPGYSAALASYYSTNPQITVLENSTNAQCVRHTQLGITAANFWQSASYTSGGITVNSKASVLAQQSGSTIDLSLSDPTQTNVGTISVSFSNTGSNSLTSADLGITNIVTSSTNVGFTAIVNNSFGKTFHARFSTSTNSPPSVSVTSPLNNAALTNPSSITISASAAGSNGSSIAGVAFYDGATLLGSSSTAPYSIVETSPVSGVHSYTAVATDNNGLQTMSLPVLISVTTYLPPTANSETFSTMTGAPVMIDLSTLATDSLTPASMLYFSTGSASNGTVVVTNGHYAVFTPTPGYSGPASFTYSVNNTAPNSTILLNYNFETNSGTTNGSVVNDASINSNSATLLVTGTGSASFANTGFTNLSPQITNCLTILQSTNGGVEIPKSLPPTTLNFTNQNWSISGWFNNSSTNNMHTIFQIGSASGKSPSALTFYVETNSYLRLNDYFTNSSTNGSITIPASSTITNKVSTNTWYQFVVTSSNNLIAVYLNGTNIASATNPIITYSNNLVSFGGVTNTSAVWYRWFNGSLADMAVFNTALSSNQVTSLALMPVANFGGLSSSNVISVNVTASATITLSNTNQIYTGLAEPVSSSVSPTNALPVLLTYSNALYPSSTNAPTNSGTYSVTAGISNSSYFGSATGTLIITPANPVIVISGGTNVPYNGYPSSVSANVSPSGIPLTVTYNGVTSAPTAVGTYSVIASNTADGVNSNWIASATNATLTIYDPISAWRQAYYGSTDNSGSAASTSQCGNGFDNNAAYTFGVNPTNPITTPLLSVSNGSNNSITLSFTALSAGTAAGYSGLTRYYNLESSTNLSDPNSWSPVSGFSNIIGSNQSVVLLTNTTSQSKSFFRLKAWLQ